MLHVCHRPQNTQNFANLNIDLRVFHFQFTNFILFYISQPYKTTTTKHQTKQNLYPMSQSCGYVVIFMPTSMSYCCIKVENHQCGNVNHAIVW